MTRHDLTGATFGRLTVQRQGEWHITNSRHRRRTWVCSCICGNTKTIWASQLLNGGTLSCGCFSKELLSSRSSKPHGEAAKKSILGSYKASAKRRKISFILNDDQFFELIMSNCFYCGSAPSRIRMSSKDYRDGNVDGSLVCGGIDRLDSGIGYEEANCVPACKICNFAKQSLSALEFIQWIHRASAHLRSDVIIER